MRNYSHKGYHPYGVGEMLCIDCWATSDMFDQECNPTEEAIQNGCKFEIHDEKNAFLYPPIDGANRVHFVREA